MSRDTNRLPRLYSVRQVAELLGISTKTVRRRIRDRELMVHRVGRQIRISEDDYRSYVAGRRQWLAQPLGETAD